MVVFLTPNAVTTTQNVYGNLGVWSQCFLASTYRVEKRALPSSDMIFEFDRRQGKRSRFPSTIGIYHLIDKSEGIPKKYREK